ncbi:MAG: P-loop NTPase [Sedimentisphaerales bacterium]|nr:P-loop NTPase [Sedimentisphaerales bacterium]
MTNNIKHKYLVLSGKGGVGKSSVAVNLAVWLAGRGENTGLLDVDIHGPSVPKLLSLEEAVVEGRDDKIVPVRYGERLQVMSVGLLLKDRNEALIWRGPMKHNVIQQFVRDVLWEDLNYLVVDCPPGTGDEPLSVAQLLGAVDGAVIVTTPQDLAIVDVRKCVTFCRQLDIPVAGVIENMSGFVCPHCNRRTDVFGADGGRRMAEESGVPFLGSIPMDAELMAACDAGKPFVDFKKDSPTAQALTHAFAPLLDGEQTTTEKKEQNTMKIAIPLVNGRLSAHFGHCEQFAIVETGDGNEIENTTLLTPPAHEPGVLPAWLAEQGASLIIAGGMGRRAQDLFRQSNIDVVVGAPDAELETLVSDYLAGRLQCGQNICDH